MRSDLACGLHPALLDQVFPFHIVLGPDLAIRQAGSALRRLCPEMVPSRHLGDLVEVITPALDVSWESLTSRPRSLFVLKLINSELRLRGQILSDDVSETVIFVGSPWITDLSSLAGLGLTLADFSVSDNVVDYLLLLQTQATALARARALAENIERNAEALKVHASHLERLTRQLDSVLNSAGEGIYGVDTRGAITFINEGAARLLRTPRADMLGCQVDKVVQWEASPIAAGLSPEPSDEVGSARPVSGRHRRGDGTRFDSEVVSAPILEGTEVVGSVVVFRDISDRRAVERLKDEFISMVSHELRTPLTSIRGALGLLGSGSTGVLEPVAAQMVEVATISTDRLIRLTTDILEVERMAAGKLAINMRSISVQSLIQAVGEEMGGLAESSGVHLRSDPGPEAMVLADCDRIIQTLSNLVGNAVKFSEAGSTVEIGASVHNENVEFHVRDTGPGIPTDQLEAIFEPFRQVDSSDTREKGGSGLGLAICRGLVQRHGGRIWATSEMGSGTKVSFTLPRTRKAPVS